MATSPNYAATPNAPAVTISTANTARDGTGTIATVFTAGSNGSRLEDITIKAQGSTTAGMVRLFLHDGTSARLWREIQVPAVTPSGTVPSWEIRFPIYLFLQSGYSLRASTNNAESFTVVANGGNL